MCTRFGGRRFFATFLAVFLLLSTAASPEVRAADPVAHASSVLLADSSDDSFSLRKFFASLNRRERVVQFCAAVMCLALFILCKKLGDDGR